MEVRKKRSVSVQHLSADGSFCTKEYMYRLVGLNWLASLLNCQTSRAMEMIDEHVRVACNQLHRMTFFAVRLIKLYYMGRASAFKCFKACADLWVRRCSPPD